MICTAFFLFLSTHTSSYANGDLSFFEDPDTRAAHAEARKQKLSTLLFIEDLSSWLKGKDRLSTAELQAVKSSVSKMKGRHGFSSSFALQEIACKIDETIGTDSQVQELKRVLAIHQDCLAAVASGRWVNPLDWFEDLANHPSSTWDNKRKAGSVAFSAENYSQAIRWYEHVSRGPEATLEDLRNLARAAESANDSFKALHWRELIANDTDATQDDKLRTGLAAYRTLLYARALRWYEPNLKLKNSLSWEHVRAAAHSAYHLRQPVKALQWFTELANSPKGTSADKQMIIQCNSELERNW